MAKTTVRKTIDLPEKLSEKVDQYQESHFHTTNSQAIIQLIHMGLTYSEKIQQQTLHPLYDEATEEK